MKTTHQIPTLSDIRSVRSVGATSVPKAHRPGHLELYVLGMEKSRLIKELSALDKRRAMARKHFDEINKRVEQLQRETCNQQRSINNENTPAKPLKTVSINY